MAYVGGPPPARAARSDAYGQGGHTSVTDDVIVSLTASGSDQTRREVLELSADEFAAAFDVPTATPLGRGAFGETWRLDDHDGGQRAAKVILSATYSQPRLAREVEGLGRVNHPNVVKLLAATSVVLARGSRAALLFEYVPGGDAATRLLPGTRIAPLDVARFGAGTLSGLFALHGADLVHRDIKPQNIAVREGDWGRPVLLDLGGTSTAPSCTRSPTATTSPSPVNRTTSRAAATSAANLPQRPPTSSRSPTCTTCWSAPT